MWLLAFDWIHPVDSVTEAVKDAFSWLLQAIGNLLLAGFNALIAPLLDWWSGLNGWIVEACGLSPLVPWFNALEQWVPVSFGLKCLEVYCVEVGIYLLYKLVMKAVPHFGQ